MKYNIVVLGVLSVVLAGCGAETETDTVAVAQAAKDKAAAKAADPIGRMARAVGGGKPGAAVEIRYEFLSKPEVGKPVEVELALIPNAGVSALDLVITGMDGVSLSGPLTETFSDVKAGEPYRHKISVLPERTGVFYLTVAATTHIGAATMGKTFSVPFSVGNPPAAEKPAAPQKDADGQAIQVMPAAETTH